MKKKALPKTRVLTQKFCEVRRRNPPAARTPWPDTIVPGLSFVVQSSGHASWHVRTRLRGDQLHYVIGPFPMHGLAGARDEARRVIGLARRGVDPRDERKRGQANTVLAVFEEWMALHQQRRKSAERVRKIFEAEVLPRLGKRPAAELTRDECRGVVLGVYRRGAQTYARRVHAHLHAMLRWAAGSGLIPQNPMRDLPKPGRENPRKRYLDREELARVWIASGELGHPWDAIYRLLILTGCRLNEIRELELAEVQGDRIDLSARNKTDADFLLPLCDTARALLEGVPGAGRDGRVFVGAANPTRAKARLDALAAATDRAGLMLSAPEPIPPWQTRDIRRTLSTHANENGLADPHVVEAFENHRSGFKSGVAGVYNRALYWEQKVQLARRWEEYVLGLVGCYAPRTPPHRS